MTTRPPVDVDVLREEIQKTYTEVSTDQEQDFIFPTGRAWAEDLGYPEPELSRVPGRDGRELRRRGQPLVARPCRARVESCSTSAAAPAPTC